MRIYVARSNQMTLPEIIEIVVSVFHCASNHPSVVLGLRWFTSRELTRWFHYSSLNQTETINRLQVGQRLFQRRQEIWSFDDLKKNSVLREFST